MAKNVLMERMLDIYKSDEGIKEKMALLQTAFLDGEIIDDVEKLYDEGTLVLRSDEESGTEAFLERAENDRGINFFYPEKLKYKE